MEVSGMANPQFGINAHIASRFGGDPSGPVEVVRDSGAGWVREELRWDMVRVFGRSAAGDDGWRFAEVDRVIDAEKQAGLNVLGLLGYNTNSGAPWQPDWHMPDIEQWKDYVKRIATHFRDRIDAWEVWNEPNVAGVFWLDDTDPSDGAQRSRRVDNYIQLLRATYDTIKDVDQNIRVVSAGCSNVNPGEWLDNFCIQGGLESCDAIGVHPYVPHQSLDTNRFDSHDLPALLAFQERAGGKPLWFTELGWSSAADDGTDGSGACVGTEEAQAAYLSQQYTEILASGINLGPVFWYDLHEDPVNFNDGADNPKGREHHFGLLGCDPNDRNDWTQKKAAYFAYQEMATK
jgi:hypothetical protein